MAAFGPISLHQSYWRTAQRVHTAYKLCIFSCFCDVKVGHNFVGETEWRRIMIAGTKK